MKEARVSENVTNESKSETERLYGELIERFCKWAESRADIRVARANAFMAAARINDAS